MENSNLGRGIINSNNKIAIMLTVSDYRLTRSKTQFGSGYSRFFK